MSLEEHLSDSETPVAEAISSFQLVPLIREEAACVRAGQYHHALDH
jgi:hypothetical protein